MYIIGMKLGIWQTLTAIVYLILVIWNIKAGGNYNMALAIGGIVLILVKIIEDYFSR